MHAKEGEARAGPSRTKSARQQFRIPLKIYMTRQLGRPE